MQAAVLKEPFKIVVEERPIPTLSSEDDAIIKVSLAALCGSDLHPLRGHYPPPFDFIMGHEAIGEVHKVGKNVKNFKQGDQIVSPFTISCGACFYCERGNTSRCVKSRLFGSAALPGMQAEYCNIPLADSTLYHAPAGMSPEVLILMADIFPTGYYVAKNAFDLLQDKKRDDSVALVLGCGPVGLCAITSAKTFFGKVYAFDLVAERRKQAELHGAIPIEESKLKETILEATNGRGADAVLEVVGVSQALNMAIDLARPWGAISSCGVHTKPFETNAGTLYNKNLRFQFGRCPVRGVFGPALELLKKNNDLFKSFVQNQVPLSEAPKYYELFEQNQVMKTVFIPGK